MIHSGSTVIAAVSGGPDSIAMLHVLNILSRGDRFRIVVAHLNHMLRAESSEDTAFVQAIASKMGLQCRVKEIDVKAAATGQGTSIEDAGRRARYTFFESLRESEEADVIATGHNLDDELETFFLRLFRGSSLQGLRGIAPVRDRVIRPLIRIGKAEILRFLDECKIPYKVDRTNLQSDVDRNFIRNRLFPLIDERFAGFRHPLGRTIELIRSENRLVEHLTSNLFAETILQRDNELVAIVSALLRAPDELVSRVILSALYNLSGPGTRWGKSHVRLVLKVLRNAKPSARADLGSGVSVCREYDRMIFTCRKEDPLPDSTSMIVGRPGQFRVPGSEIILEFSVLSRSREILQPKYSADTAYFDADQVQFPLIVRFPQPGDRFRPWGIAGSRKLKKVLIDLKIPQRSRSRLPLVVKGEDILWIPGIRRGQVAPVTPETSRLLKVRLIKEEQIP